MADNKKIERIVGRFKILYIIALLGAFVVLFRIVSLQYFVEDRTSIDDIYTEQSIEAKRGSILATDGRPLAISVPSYQIRMDCLAPHDTIWKKELNALSSSLSELFKNKSAKGYYQELQQARKDKKRYYTIGNREISYLELQEAEQFPIFRYGRFKGGFLVVPKNKRENPSAALP